MTIWFSLAFNVQKLLTEAPPFPHPSALVQVNHWAALMCPTDVKFDAW